VSESSPICEETLRGNISGGGGDKKKYVFHIQELQKKIEREFCFQSYH
jgi:hypothetical protein